MFINYGLNQIDLKIVYYGPGFSGKTTNLEWAHAHIDPGLRSDILNLKTKEDRTIFFDFMQFEVGKIKGLTPKFNLYTVPGQDIYTVSRKIILNGVDGIIYVADSGAPRMRDNLFTLIDLVKNLRANKHQVEEFPIIFQYNKRDLPDAVPLPVLRKTLNRFSAPEFEACAAKGEGVFECLKTAIELVVQRVTKLV
ncbi:MAG: gliding-motility protein MglA [Bdellovibrionales bacterium]|nr:gliding-motility protein MglA [Bdellovibrionales bacterium]